MERHCREGRKLEKELEGRGGSIVEGDCKKEWKVKNRSKELEGKGRQELVYM